jgi:hypothetical protein
MRFDIATASGKIGKIMVTYLTRFFGIVDYTLTNNPPALTAPTRVI